MKIATQVKHIREGGLSRICQDCGAVQPGSQPVIDPCWNCKSRMTVEIPRVEIIEVKRWWGNYSVIFQRSQPGKMKLAPDDLPLKQLQADIILDPDGFLAFAQAIYDELKANQPPKPRKERSDKGSKKGVQITKDTILGGISTGEDCLTLGIRKPRLNINTLNSSQSME